MSSKSKMFAVLMDKIVDLWERSEYMTEAEFRQEMKCLKRVIKGSHVKKDEKAELLYRLKHL